MFTDDWNLINKIRRSKKDDWSHSLLVKFYRSKTTTKQIIS